MALMSEFQEERKAVWENGTTKQKIQYVWDYYKWHILIPIIVVAVIIWYIVQVVTAKDTLFQGIFLNAYGTNTYDTTTEWLDEFYELQEINTDKEEISLNTSLYYTAGNVNANYETLQVLMAWNAAECLDFMAGDVSSLTELSYRGYFTDLRKILTDEQLEAYEPYFLYMDQEVYTKRMEMSDNLEDVSTLEYPDAAKPEEMTDPIPVLIDMSKSEKMTELYSELDDTIVFGVTSSCQNTELVLEFLEYLRQ